MKEFRVTRSAQLVARASALLLGAAAAFVLATPASARVLDKDMENLVAPQDPGTLRNGGHNTPQAVPEINGPGRVSTVGNVWLKTTNIGVMGNPFPANSSDPRISRPARGCRWARTTWARMSSRACFGAASPLCG